MRIISVDPSAGNAHAALWLDGTLQRVERLVSYEGPHWDVDLFVTEQMTVFNMAGARALIQVAYDAGMRAGPYAEAQVPCVALLASEWRAELGIEGANRSRKKAAVDADVREACLREVPGLERILSPLRGARGRLAQDAWDCVAIGLAAYRLIGRLGLGTLVGHCRLPRDLRRSGQLPR